MNACYSENGRTRLRALILPVTLAAALVALALPSRGSTITFNPTGGGTGSGAITGVSGFGYATSSALALGSGTPTVGQTFSLFYESVINATAGTTSNVGPNFSINGSANEFTVIAGFRETITSIAPDGTITFALASPPTFSTGTANPNFFEILANPAGTVNPSTGNGAGFGTGTVILSGHLIPDNFAGAFKLSSATPTGPFNTSGLPTAITTPSTINGGGGTQLTVAVDSVNAGFFPTSPGSLIFTTTNSLPFAAVAPLSGFYSAPGSTPDITYPGTPPTGFNTGGPTSGPNTTGINGVNGNSTMFQTIANNSFSPLAVPEPSSIIPALTAVTAIPMFLCFRRRRSSKTAA